jgi:hypothetical protein
MCLLDALTDPKGNLHWWKPKTLAFLFAQAEPARLRTAGDPLPGSGPFRLFRGVAGTGRHRQVSGRFWTSNLDMARWFARRFPVLPDPAVYTITVPASHIYAYSNERHEDDYIVRLPLPTRPRLFERLEHTGKNPRPTTGHHGVQPAV